ncbi:MAG: hypothetical protein AB1918_09530 [Pseudomonadota bacterium]
MRFKSIAAAIAALTFLPINSVSAQTAPTQPTASAPAPIDMVNVPIWPTTAVQLPDTQPVPASFSLGSIEGVSPALLSGVTAKGYARKVSVEDQTIGQVLVMTVAKNGREEAISAEGLAAQFDASETSQLFPEKTVEVQGSKTALVAALERLAAPQKDDGEKQVVKDTVSDNPTSAGGGSSNDEAAGYRSPDMPTIQAPADDTPVVDIRVTSEGCPVRIDTAQGKAFRQSKEQTFTDGALTSESACSDSEVSFLLQRSYMACPTDIVDLAAMTAWPQYSLYYVDDAGESHAVGECTKDEEAAYAIIEDESQCTMFLDFSTNQAVPQAALVYTNRNNALVQARGCDTSTKSAALPMTESAANCPLRHDFGAGLSFELTMWTYVRGGVTYQAAPCADSGRTFQHETVYADASGNYICTPITNLDARTVALQSRKRISFDGVSQFVTECTPDTSTQAILATTDGCMDPSKWTHDLDAGVSYGQERFYYLKANGVREYVSPCQNSAATYSHNQTITGYQAHDDQLWAYPLSTVTISVNGSPYTVASSQVLPGAPQVPYVLAGTVEQQSGVRTYEGCNAYSETIRYEKWARPDATEFLKSVGAGSPIGPTFACTYSGGTQTTDWPKQSQWVYSATPECAQGFTNSDGEYHCIWYHNYYVMAGKYKATRITTREDGVVVSSQTEEKTWVGCANNLGSPADCPVNADGTRVNQWRGELGW